MPATQAPLDAVRSPNPMTLSPQSGSPPLSPPAEKDREKKKDSAVVLQLTKTKMCAFFEKGKCSSETCRYAHSLSELRCPPNLQKTKLCKSFLQGKCKLGENCSFAHGDADLRVTSGIYKTQMCNFYERGHCKKGDRCNHAHGDADLRPTFSPRKTPAKEKGFTTVPQTPEGRTPSKLLNGGAADFSPYKDSEPSQRKERLPLAELLESQEETEADKACQPSVAELAALAFGPPGLPPADLRAVFSPQKTPVREKGYTSVPQTPETRTPPRLSHGGGADFSPNRDFEISQRKEHLPLADLLESQETEAEAACQPSVAELAAVAFGPPGLPPADLGSVLSPQKTPVRERGYGKMLQTPDFRTPRKVSHGGNYSPNPDFEPRHRKERLPLAELLESQEEKEPEAAGQASVAELAALSLVPPIPLSWAYPTAHETAYPGCDAMTPLRILDPVDLLVGDRWEGREAASASWGPMSPNPLLASWSMTETDYWTDAWDAHRGFSPGQGSSL